jgi:chaperonin cofactor prefoldin
MTAEELSKSSLGPESGASGYGSPEASSAFGSADSAGLKSDWSTRIDALRQQETDLKRSIADLQATYNRLTQDQFQKIQADVSRMVQQGTADLEQRKRTLQKEIETLERRQERIQAEMRTTFAGASQDLAVRVQGFKDYLVGSLQDLSVAAEQLDLSPAVRPTAASEMDNRGDVGMERFANRSSPRRAAEPAPGQPAFASNAFQDQTERIRSLLDQYRMRPDYYGPLWQLRRTFEPIHAERVSNWFFAQGGRGAVKSMGSRLQNVLVASSALSILYALYGNRLRTLVLSNSPERLGEWRRGLQDCLGISRADFGTGQGVMLFDAPEPLAQRADRITADNGLPFIVVDEAESVISLALLQFPLWLAFAPDPMNPVAEYDY